MYIFRVDNLGGQYKMEKIMKILESLKERKIDVEDAIFEIEGYIDEDYILLIEELEALDKEDERFKIEIQRIIALVEDSDIKYRKASYKDVKKLVSNSSLEELDRLIRDLRDEEGKSNL